MLTDIFARRYKELSFWKEVGDTEKRLLVQCYRILAEQLIPVNYTQASYHENAEVWENVHNRISMELGLEELSIGRAAARNPYLAGGAPSQISPDTRCKAWILREPESLPPDRFMMERLSFFELAFRAFEAKVNQFASKEQDRVRAKFSFETRRKRRSDTSAPSANELAVAARNIAAQETANFRKFFSNNVFELNQRLHQAQVPLHYHNGFLQISADEIVAKNIETPFWPLVSDAKWKNVDTDMKEAIDRRDSKGRDPAFYAARALESAIKIANAEKQWATGKERGASDHVTSLSGQGRLLSEWEQLLLKRFFADIRNPLSHGPGPEESLSLSPYQTDWAIEFCISWIKRIVSEIRKTKTTTNSQH